MSILRCICFAVKVRKNRFGLKLSALNFFYIEGVNQKVSRCFGILRSFMELKSILSDLNMTKFILHEQYEQCALRATSSSADHPIKIE